MRAIERRTEVESKKYRYAWELIPRQIDLDTGIITYPYTCQYAGRQT